MSQERAQFVHECLSGEWTVTELCRRYGISRKTGHKYLARYKEEGWEGLEDKSRAPHSQGRRVPPHVVREILALKKRHRTWGAPKLRDWFLTNRGDEAWPATSTIHEVLARKGFVRKRRKRYRAVPSAQPLAHAQSANDVWCADFKGKFRTGSGDWCEPFTVTDAFSRYSISCQGLQRTGFAHVQPLLKKAFQEYGLPRAFRTDNGPPFSSRGFAGLSKLSIWLVRLGVRVERIRPASPQENGRHERFHLTLKQDTATPPARTLRGQQRRFNQFRRTYNQERPHEALGGRPPIYYYEPSTRQYPSKLPALEYPETSPDYLVRKVHAQGVIGIYGVKYYLTEALLGEYVGLERISNRRWAIHFGSLEIGVIDVETHKVWPHKVIRYAGPPEECHPCDRNETSGGNANGVSS